MWAKAYLEQARSDWETYAIVASNGCALCHELHYLQMTTEKLGKAALLTSRTSGLDAVSKTHKAFVSFLRVAARNPNLQKELSMNGRQLREYIVALLPLADQIERLAPTLCQGGPNAEYPWSTPAGQVLAPASYAFSVSGDLSNSMGRKLLKLIDLILAKSEALL